MGSNTHWWNWKYQYNWSEGCWKFSLNKNGVSMILSTIFLCFFVKNVRKNILKRVCYSENILFYLYLVIFFRHWLIILSLEKIWPDEIGKKSHIRSFSPVMTVASYLSHLLAAAKASRCCRWLATSYHPLPVIRLSFRTLWEPIIILSLHWMQFFSTFVINLNFARATIPKVSSLVFGPLWGVCPLSNPCISLLHLWILLSKMPKYFIVKIFYFLTWLAFIYMRY